MNESSEPEDCPAEIIKEELWRHVEWATSQLSDYPNNVADNIVAALTAAGYTIVKTRIKMCEEPGCVLADGHRLGEHREHRVSMLACPHNVPNFGPCCPICDTASVRLGAEMRYELYGDPRER